MKTKFKPALGSLLPALDWGWDVRGSGGLLEPAVATAKAAAADAVLDLKIK